MRWTPKRKPYKRPRYFGKYDPWFAWYPIELDTGEMVWLEWVMAKRENKSYKTTNMFGAPRYDYYVVWSYKKKD